MNSQGNNEDFQIEIILISSVKPSGKTAGAILFNRHFSLLPKSFEVSILPADIREVFPATQNRFFKRIRKTRFAKYLDEFFWRIHTHLPIHLLLTKPDARRAGKTVVMTLAMDHAYLVAQKYAKKHQLPLVARFDDWFPDMANFRASVKKRLDFQYNRLHQVADSKIYISHGMKDYLGDSNNGFVIYPIPESHRLRLPLKTPSKPYRICYLGNMYHYGPMLAKLAEESLAHKELKIEFRGDDPNWPIETKAKFRNLNQLHGFLEGPGLLTWSAEFDAYLVAMLFEDDGERRSKTCFPTKFPDYCSLGRPIILWAPEYSAVVRWAKKNRSALCVTESDPKAVIAAIQKLAGELEEQRRLGDAARAAYEGEFAPSRLQGLFEQAIETALNPKIL